MIALKKEKIECRIYNHEFPLHNSPAAVQLTKHIENIKATYGIGMVKLVFKPILQGKKVPANKTGAVFRFNQLIQYYGLNYVKDWFSHIYGWEF